MQEWGMARRSALRGGLAAVVARLAPGRAMAADANRPVAPSPGLLAAVDASGMRGVDVWEHVTAPGYSTLLVTGVYPQQWTMFRTENLLPDDPIADWESENLIVLEPVSP